MISLPIWLFVLLCVFGFLGVCTFCLIIYAIISALFIPVYRYDADKEKEYGTQESEQE